MVRIWEVSWPTSGVGDWLGMGNLGVVWLEIQEGVRGGELDSKVGFCEMAGPFMEVGLWHPGTG